MIAGTIINLIIIAIIIGIVYLRIYGKKIDKQTKEISERQLKKYENLQREAQQRQNTIVNKKEKKNQQYQQQQYQQYLNQQQQYQQYINQQQQYQQYISQQQQYQQHKQNYNRLPYSLIESVLTNYEKILYSILAPFCSKYNFILLSKVRIADFVKPLQQNNRSNFYHWFNRIASKHVDFLICQPQTFRPLVAIELDDYTHKYKSRQERDIFVDDVYASIGLPVLHITQLQEYNIVRQLSEILNVNLTIDNASVQ